MHDERPTLDQVEAMLRMAGIRDEIMVTALLEMIDDYAENGIGDAYSTQPCICANWDGKVRSRITALVSGMTLPEHSVKACYVCDAVLPLTEYYYDSRKADGRQGTCKECKRVQRMRRLRILKTGQKLSRQGFPIEPEWFTERDSAEM